MNNRIPLRHQFWRSFYDLFAFIYDAILRLGDLLHIGNEERIRSKIIAKLQGAPNARLLELGCGTAENRLNLPVDLTYIGLDISINMLRRARTKCSEANLGADFVQADAQFLPMRKNIFERIIAMGVIQHLASPASSFSELRRVSALKAHWLIIDELQAAKRILPHLTGDAPSVTFGEYFIADVVNGN